MIQLYDDKIKVMDIYVFGNIDLDLDNNALKVAKELQGKIKGINFIDVKPNEDLPFIDLEKVVIMDVVEGLKEIKIIEDKDLDKIILPPRTSAHDFDLGFQIKYLKKLGKLGEIKIIALPQSGEMDYDSIHSILRKLVAQDMQGS